VTRSNHAEEKVSNVLRVGIDQQVDPNT